MTYYITPKGEVVEFSECEKADKCECCGEIKPMDKMASVHIDGSLIGSVCDTCSGSSRPVIGFNSEGYHIDDRNFVL